MRKITALLLCVAFLGAGMAFGGAGDKIGEHIVERVFGIDVEGATVTVTREDGNTYLYSNVEWPRSGLAEKLPRPRTGRVICSTLCPSYCCIELEGVRERDFFEYLKKVKSRGFERAGDISFNIAFKRYVARDDLSRKLMLVYNTGDKTLGIFLENYESMSLL